MMAIETSSRRSAVVAPTMNSVNLETIWVFGDQLNRDIGALRLARPDTHQILMVESRAKVASRRWHIQRAHFIVASMRRFADELREEGFSVDYQRADSMRDGVRRHQEMCAPSQISVTEPNSFAARELVASLDVHVELSDQFLCHPSLFEEFAGTRKTFKMEDFYRWQRKRLNILMDGDTPVGGQWNFDEENREPPPKTGHDRWPQPVYAQLDEIDAEVMRDVSETTWGAVPDGTWATSRRGALERLDFFVKELLPMFGEHEDAMLQSNWHLAHSLLSPYLNIGLLLPGEVVNAAQEAFRSGKVPINSAEGFTRQVIGWREFMWNCYWRWMPEYKDLNALQATRPLPPLFTRSKPTPMRCMQSALEHVHDRAYAHHIERLMVLGNFALISGVNPQQFTTWMWNSFIDAAEWVMVPNVIGMSQFADGGMLATKPYASGGAYIDRMSDHCKGCVFDRKKRVGEDACPFTVLYWDFFLRHAEVFVKNPRVARQVRAGQQLSDSDEVRETARVILARLDSGDL